MALTVVPSAHYLSIGSGLRSRKEEELFDGFGCCYQPASSHRRTRFSAKALENLGDFERKRSFKVRAQAISDATANTDYRSIGQVNEAIRNSDSVKGALKILEETKAAGIHTPNEATYASLMLACRKHRQGERALTVYEAMKQAKEPISIRTYNTLISCCQQSLRLDDALRVKSELEEAGAKPDVVTYTSLLDTVVRTPRVSAAQRLQKALQLYKEMENLGIVPDIKTYNAIIQAAGDGKAADKALDLYNSLLKSGLTPNAFTYDILLKCLGSGGRLKLALQVYNEARAAGVSLYTSTYNFLIEACATAPQPNAEKAWSFFEEMKSNNLRVTAQTYINLISASSKAADNTGVMRAFQLMKDAGLTKSITTTAYNQIIESASAANTLHEALEIYNEMKKAGFKPNASTYSSLISACIRNKDYKQAETLEEEEFKNVDVSSNQSVLHSLIRAYGEGDKWEDSVRIFRDMLSKKGMAPTEESFASVFEACFGKERMAALLAAAENQKIEITEGIETGMQLYEEFASKGQFSNFSTANLARCDVKTVSHSVVIFAILSWLKAVRQDPPASDLLVVTGNVKEVDNTPGTGKPKYSKRHTLVMKTVRGLGLPVMRLNTLAMLTLTVSSQSVKKWARGPDPFTKAEKTVSDGTEEEESTEKSTEAAAQVSDSATTESVAEVEDSAVTEAAVEVNDSAATEAEVNDSAATEAEVNDSAATEAEVNDLTEETMKDVDGAVAA